MKAIYYFFPILLYPLFASCSSSDDEVTIVNDGGRKLRYLTITQVEGDKATRSLFDLTRASLTDNVNTLTASWTAGDNLAYCNLSYLDKSNYFPTSSILGTLMAQSTAENSVFKGSITCDIGDHIALAFPINVSNISYNTYNATFSLDLSGQDGTLETLANNYHFVCGIADITSVTDNTATATIQMKSLLSLCKFTFLDASNAIIPIESLSICYREGSSINEPSKYPLTASIKLSQSDEFNDIIVEAKNGETTQLIIKPARNLAEVYVALLPTGSNSRTFKFIVNGEYYCEANAKLFAGEFYPTFLYLNKLNN
jgi:hypothetical protein